MDPEHVAGSFMLRYHFPPIVPVSRENINALSPIWQAQVPTKEWLMVETVILLTCKQKEERKRPGGVHIFNGRDLNHIHWSRIPASALDHKYAKISDQTRQYNIWMYNLITYNHYPLHQCMHVVILDTYPLQLWEGHQESQPVDERREQTLELSI